MEFQVIGDGLKSVLGDQAEEYHKYFLANGMIWAFSLKYHEQSQFNYGHRVVHKGGYAIPFDTTSNKWGVPQFFDSITTEQNVGEELFTLNGQIYLLTYVNFGQIHPLSLFKWDGRAWLQEETQGPPALPTSSSNVRVTAHVVDDVAPNGRYIIFNAEHTIHLYRLSFDLAQPVIEPVAVVPREVTMLPLVSTSAVRAYGKVIISFMTLGCGYQWQKNRFIVYDEGTGQFEHIMLPDETAESVPPFGFSGAAGHGLALDGDWIHAGGCRQVGMTGSDFEGSVWALRNLDSIPVWHKLSLVIPPEIGGTSVVDPESMDIYLIGESVAKGLLN